MKIKNDLISIKTGKKTYDFSNLILDDYLYRFVMRQTSPDFINIGRYIPRARYCLIKFDTPIEGLNPHSELLNTDFDICMLTIPSYDQSLDEKRVTITSQYNNVDYVWDYRNNSATDDLSPYYGKKITALGFNSWWAPNSHPVCAVLDTSNYGIYMERSQDLSITRRDVITTDADFISNSPLVTGPAHLAPYGTPQIIYQPPIYDQDHESWSHYYDNGYGILYSVMFSQTKPTSTANLPKELIIGKDIFVKPNNTQLKKVEVGDNLSGKRLLFSFPDDGFYLSEEAEYSTDIITGSSSNYKIRAGQQYYQSTNETAQWVMVVDGDKHDHIYDYTYDYNTQEGEVTTNFKEYRLSNNFGVVTSINPNVSVYQFIDEEVPLTSDSLIFSSFTNTEGLYPSEELFPSDELYPLLADSKYIILKYKVWQIVHSGTSENEIATPTDTGLFYCETIPIDKFGELQLKIKYERG